MRDFIRFAEQHMRISLFLLIFVAAIGNLPANSLEKYWINTKSGLILRSEPDRNSNRILTMPYGSMVHLIESSNHSEVIDGKEGTWIKINFGKTDGWAFSGFLTSQNPRNSLFKWNKSQSMFLILTNKKGAATDCGEGYSDRNCEVSVYQNERIIFHRNMQQFVEWRNDSEIILSSGQAECSGGESDSQAIEVITGKQTGYIHTGFSNQGCGMPETEDYDTIYTACSNNNCASFNVSRSVVTIYLGLPDYQLANPFIKLQLLAKQQLNGDFSANPDFDEITFKNGKNSYGIDFTNRSLRKLSQH
jgi:hypothetical protein